MNSSLSFVLFMFVVGVTNAEICRDVVKTTDTNLKISINAERNNCGKWQKNVNVFNYNEVKNNIDVEQRVHGNITTFVISVVENGKYSNIKPTHTKQGCSSKFRDDYTLYPGQGYYKYHIQEALWPNAKYICELEGAHLAIINSQAEADILTSLFNSYPKSSAPFPSFALLGFHDKFVEGQFVTILGGSLKDTGYTKWGVGQPDNYQGQNCGCFKNDGLLDDCTCNIPYNFICEKELENCACT